MILQSFYTLQGTTGFSNGVSTSRYIIQPSRQHPFFTASSYTTRKYILFEESLIVQRRSRRRKILTCHPSHKQHHHDSYSNDDHTNSLLHMTSENSFFEPGGGPTVILEPNSTSTEIYSRAITRTIQWVIASAIFGSILWSMYGHDTSYEFFAGYLVEQSLSVDNLFVFLLLFDYFKVPLAAQDRVLNWGIYGAIVMRAAMIGLGSVALSKFHVVLLIFAGILVYSSISALWSMMSSHEGEDEDEDDMSDNKIVQFSRTLIDSTDYFDGDRFFTLVNGVKKATPLFICMIALEISDVVFAVDSIPAVFGVTSVCVTCFVLMFRFCNVVWVVYLFLTFFECIT